jgi:hypothetical protein
VRALPASASAIPFISDAAAVRTSRIIITTAGGAIYP